jgi:ABC-type nitrate/sulfonate/bicarbonate transport system substrate-binding protein
MTWTRGKKWALLALLFFGHSVPAGAQMTKVAIGYSGISADQLVIWVAKDTGIFAKNSLDAQPIYFTGGTTSVTAMVSGDTPLIQASGPVSSARDWLAPIRSMSSAAS